MLVRIVTVLVLAAMGVGCVHGVPMGEARQIERDALDRVIWWRCRDGSTWGPRCGLITDTMATDDYRARFASEKCQQLTAKSCSKLYWQMLAAHWEDRYTMADWDAVWRECDKDPGSCDDPRVLETLLLQSHDRAVEEWAAGRMHDAAQAAEDRRREAWSDFGARMSGSTVCKTRETSTGLRTECSQPIGQAR